MNTGWETPNAEPSLDEILEDPIVRLLMQGDHTGESEVRQLIARVRDSLAKSDGDEPAGPATPRKARSSGTTRAA